jgi:hypothetical protein
VVSVSVSVHVSVSADQYVPVSFQLHITPTPKTETYMRVCFNYCGSPPPFSQLTTWHPVLENASSFPVSDYASKHWSGLISDYYAARVMLVMGQALVDAEAGNPLNTTAVDAIKAKHAFAWTTATNRYPTSPASGALAVSTAMWRKYEGYFSAC